MHMYTKHEPYLIARACLIIDAQALSPLRGEGFERRSYDSSSVEPL